MPRLRTAKAVASRIDLNYFKRWHALRSGRMLVTVLCVAAAVGWWGMYGTMGQTAIYNPGPVASPHAMIENNCRACHDGDGKGGFFQTVSDNACLTCHDSALHAPTQTQFVALAGPKNSPHGGMSEGATAAPTSPRLRSADCVQCHTEHKGEIALRGTSDQHCVQCHDNLPAHTKGGRPFTEPHVTKFTLADHPAFGRNLTETKAAGQKDPTLLDGTKLSFNHAKHMPMEEIKADCSKCHTTADPDPRAKPPTFGREDSPPWSGEKDRPSKWDVSADRAYMRPVSYEKHCAGCHRIELPGGVVLPHDRMEVVRGVVAGLTPEQLQWLAPIPKPVVPAAGEGASPASPPAGGGGIRPPPIRRPRFMGPDDAPVRQIQLRPPPRPGAPAAPAAARPAGSEGTAPATANDVALRKLENDVRRMKSDTEERKKTRDGVVETLKQIREALKPATTAPATQPTAANWRVDPSLVEIYVAYMASNSCVMCHDVQGTVPRLASTAAPAAPPAPAAGEGGETAKPAAASATLLRTASTGIPASPRRWFEHSFFDHASHQNITCQSCHATAAASALTSDVLSPNINWKTTDGQTHSCTECHHEPTAASRGAEAGCQTCHLYHDRALEGPPLGVSSLTEVVNWGHGQTLPPSKLRPGASGEGMPAEGTPAAGAATNPAGP